MAETSTDNKWSMTSEQAQSYIINPLHTDPLEETGLNAHFPSTFAKRPQEPIVLQSNNPFNPSNPSSPTRKAHRLSQGSQSSQRTPPKSPPNRRSRGNSLTERFPGDQSHRPLAMLTNNHKTAEKTHRKRASSNLDSIDALDSVPGGGYHHGGPFDATLATNNLNPLTSPVAAVKESNEAALKATPAEKVRDALERHLPLDGVASVPPGERDGLGRSYDYRETNVMTEDGGDYGKEVRYGEIPEIDHKHDDTGLYRKVGSGDGPEEIEMRDQKKGVNVREEEVEGESSTANHHHQHRHSLTEGLKRRIGSLRHKKSPSTEEA